MRDAVRPAVPLSSPGDRAVGNHAVADLGSPPTPLAPDLAGRWMLDPAVDFLNHGSFGALPRSVAATQDRWRAAIEANPIELLGRRCRELLEAAASGVAGFVGGRSADLAFTVNATDGINAVLRSIDLAAGDELLTTSHVYNAVRQTMKYAARRAGAVYVEAKIDLPVTGGDAIAEAMVAAITPRTRLVVVDHVSSPTAIVFPVERIAAVCADRGIDCLVDGAHAPGMLPLDLTALEATGVAFYSANLHKWTCAPKGCAFLWARPDRQRGVHPTIVSHFLDEGFRREFDWQGTRDITPWLCAPAAIAFMDDPAQGLGWSRVREHNHRLATWVQRRLCDAWEVPALSPLDGAMVGSMATVRLPPSLQPERSRHGSFERLQRVLFDRFRIEVPVVQFDGAWHVRPCCQVYNRPAQYDRLVEAVAALAAEE